MLLRLALALALAAGCVQKARQVMSPEPPEGMGAFSCREIVEQCDASCSDPICLNNCTGQGTKEAAGKHAALLDCGQKNGCTDEACMKASCPGEIDACMGPQPPPEDPAATPEPAPT